MIDIFIPTIRQDISRVLDSIRQNTTVPHEVHVIREGCSYAEALNLQYLKLASLRKPEDYFFCGADDILFYPKWDTEALAVGGNVIGTNDLHNWEVLNRQHSTHYLVRYGYVIEHTCTADKSYPVAYNYVHNYVDTELVETAKARGCFRSAPASIVEHLHECFGLAKWDEGYAKSKNSKTPDRRTFESRKYLWEAIERTQPIEVITTCCLNCDDRLDYLQRTLKAFQQNISVSRLINYTISLEYEPANSPRLDKLRRLAEEFGASVIIRTEGSEARLGAHLDFCLSQLKSPIWFYLQDDWELSRPLCLDPGLSMLHEHSHVGMVRYWAATRWWNYHEEEWGWADRNASYCIADNPAIWHNRIYESLKPLDCPQDRRAHERNMAARFKHTPFHSIAPKEVVKNASYYFRHIGSKTAFAPREETLPVQWKSNSHSQEERREIRWQQVGRRR